MFKNLIFLFLFLFCSFFSQEVNGESVNNEDKSLETTVQVIKDVQEEAERESIEVKLEKAQIKREERYLKNNAQDQDVVLKEKLQTIEKRQEVVTVKEDVIKAKKDAYEKVVDLLEQKLKMLDKGFVSIHIIKKEIVKTQEEIKNLKNKEIFIKGQFESIKEEIKLLDQDIMAKKMLFELKKDSLLKDSIILQEKRKVLLDEQTEQLNKRMELLKINREILVDYLSIIKNKYWISLKQEILISKFMYPNIKEILGVVIALLVVIGLLFLNIFLKKHDNSNVKIKILKSFVKYNFIYLCIIFSTYIIGFFLGYNSFMLYFGKTVFICIFGLLYWHYFCKIFKIFILDRLFKKPYYMPFLVLLISLIYFIGVLAGLFSVLSFWNIDVFNYDLILKILFFSFFSIGKVKISLGLLIKTFGILWLLYLFVSFLNKFLYKNVYHKFNLKENAKYTISIFIKYFFIFIGLVTCLRILGFELATLAVFAGTIGIGLGFGLQEIFRNFISGLILLIERPLKVGDFVEISGLSGRVQAIQSRATIINTFDNVSVIVPNSDLIAKNVINWTHNDKVMRSCIQVGVQYGSDIDLVKSTLLETAEKHSKVLENPAPYVWFTSFGDSALIFNLYCWTDDLFNRYTMISDLHFMIDKIFKKRKIVIAFPQQDLHLKSSDVVFAVKNK